jgi:hypothetical protein
VMIRTILISSSLFLAIGSLAFGIFHWNAQLATTTENAKKELSVAAQEKEVLRLNEDSTTVVEDSVKDNHSPESSGSDATTGSTSTPDQSAIASSSEGTGSTHLEAAKKQTESSPSRNSGSNSTSSKDTSSTSAPTSGKADTSNASTPAGNSGSNNTSAKSTSSTSASTSGKADNSDAPTPAGNSGSNNTSAKSRSSTSASTSGKTDDSDASTPAGNSESTSTPGKGTSSTSASTSGESDDSDVSTPASSQSVAEIKAEYQSVFNDLEIQETSKIDQLIVQAKADYVSNKLSKAEIAAKYQEAAATLQSNADNTFNAIYQQLQNDLEKNGHNPNEAVEFKNNYEAKKQQRLSRVINEVQNF